MAISRVPGYSLLQNLDRQGIDLQFTTNSDTLVYMDFANFRFGVNTTSPTEQLDVNGNAKVRGNLIANVVYTDTLRYANGAAYSFGNPDKIVSGTSNVTVSSSYTNVVISGNSVASFSSSNLTLINANVLATNFLYANGVSVTSLIDSALSTLTSNAAAQAGDIATLYANAGAQAGSITSLFSNAAIQAGLIAAAEGNIVTANTAMKGYVDSVANNSSYSNANVASYLTIYTGNISAGNVNASAVYTDTLRYANGAAYSFGNPDKISSSASNVTVTSNYVNVAINSSNIGIFSSDGLIVDGVLKVGTSGTRLTYNSGHFGRANGDLSFQAGSEGYTSTRASIRLYNSLGIELYGGSTGAQGNIELKGGTDYEVFVSKTTTANTIGQGAFVVAGGATVWGNLFAGAVYTDVLRYANGSPYSFGNPEKISFDSSNVTVSSSYVNVAISGSNVASFSGSNLTLINANILATNFLYANGVSVTSLIDNALSTLTSNAAAQAGDIATLYANAAVQAGLIATIQGNIVAIESNIATLTANAAFQAGELATLTSNAAVQAGQLATLTSNAAVQAGDISALYANAAFQASELSTLTANAAVQAGELSTLTANAAFQAGELATLTSNAAVQAGELSTLTANAAFQAGEIASLLANAGSQQSAISSLQSNVSTLFSNAASQAGDISALYANAAVQAGLIAAAEGNIVTANTAMKGYVDSVANNSSYSNANVASYLTIYSGNVSAGNVITTAIYTDNYYFANGAPFVGGGGGGQADKISSSASNVTVTGDYVNVAINSSNVASFSSSGINTPGNLTAGSVLTDNIYFANGAPYVLSYSIVNDTFVGDGSNTIFTLSANASVNNTVVSINGVLQIPTTAYSISGNQLTFTEAPGLNETVDVRLLSTGFGAGVVTTTNVFDPTPTNVPSANAAVVIDSFATTAYSTAKYIIQVKNGSTIIESMEALLIQDGANAYITTYAIVSSNVALGTLSANVASGTARVYYTSDSLTNSNVKVAATYIV